MCVCVCVCVCVCMCVCVCITTQGGSLAMPGFNTILRRLSSLWETNREDLKAKVHTHTHTRMAACPGPEHLQCCFHLRCVLTHAGAGARALSGCSTSRALCSAVRSGGRWTHAFTIVFVSRSEGRK